jgi:hypothetical protein
MDLRGRLIYSKKRLTEARRDIVQGLAVTLNHFGKNYVKSRKGHLKFYSLYSMYYGSSQILLCWIAVMSKLKMEYST